MDYAKFENFQEFSPVFSLAHLQPVFMSYPVKMSNTLHKAMSAMIFSPFLVSFALFVFVYTLLF